MRNPDLPVERIGIIQNFCTDVPKALVVILVLLPKSLKVNLCRVEGLIASGFDF